MKHLLLTTIAAVVLVGCGESQPPEPPGISIHKAGLNRNIEAVKQHIAAGRDLNAKSSSTGFTPLPYAASWGHEEIVELLIANGADVNAKDADGLTPLDVATHPENPNDTDEIAALLRKHGGKTGEELKAVSR